MSRLPIIIIPIFQHPVPSPTLESRGVVCWDLLLVVVLKYQSSIIGEIESLSLDAQPTDARAALPPGVAVKGLSVLTLPRPVAGPSRSPSIISSRPLVERESSKDQDWESEMVGQGYHPAHQMMQMQMQPQSHLQAHPQQYVQYQHAGHVRVYPQHMLGHTPQSQVMYMQSSAPNLGRPPSVHSQRSQRSHLESEDEGEFLPMEDALPQQQLYMQSTPYHTQQMHMHGNGMVSPYAMSTPLPGSSTSPLTLMSNAMHGQSPTDGMMHYHSTPVPTHMAPPRRPGMPRHSTTTGAPRPTMQRQYSLQPPPSRMPNILAHDVFAPAPGSTPVRRAISMAGVQGEMQVSVAAADMNSAQLII